MALRGRRLSSSDVEDRRRRRRPQSSSVVVGPRSRWVIHRPCPSSIVHRRPSTVVMRPSHILLHPSLSVCVRHLSSVVRRPSSSVVVVVPRACRRPPSSSIMRRRPSSTVVAVVVLFRLPSVAIGRRPLPAVRRRPSSIVDGRHASVVHRSLSVVVSRRASSVICRRPLSFVRHPSWSSSSRSSSFVVRRPVFNVYPLPAADTVQGIRAPSHIESTDVPTGSVCILSLHKFLNRRAAALPTSCPEVGWEDSTFAGPLAIPSGSPAHPCVKPDTVRNLSLGQYCNHPLIRPQKIDWQDKAKLTMFFVKSVLFTTSGRFGNFDGQGRLCKQF